MTPSSFRRKGEGVEIAFTTVPTKLGKLLIAKTPRGVCSVQFGESESALADALREEFRAANISRDDRGLAAIAEKLKEFVNGFRVSLDIPLDIQGTAFQQQVWNALRRIPYGQTRSYTEIAKTVGKPAAVRAVANACGSNHAALIIPCHRVVGACGARPHCWKRRARHADCLTLPAMPPWDRALRHAAPGDSWRSTRRLPIRP